MHYLLIFGAFLLFLFMAPVKTSMVACAALLVIATVVRTLTRAVTGTEATYGEAFKAVGLAFVFLFIAQFTLMSFSRGTGITSFDGFPGVTVSGALFAAYVAGFSVALDTTFGASILIATISTVASVLTLWAAASLL